MFNFPNKSAEILIRRILNLQINLGRTGTFAALGLLITEWAPLLLKSCLSTVAFGVVYASFTKFNSSILFFYNIVNEFIFKFLFVHLLIYKNTVVSIDLYLANLANSLSSSSGFLFGRCLRVFYADGHVMSTYDSFTPTFQICMPFLPSLCLYCISQNLLYNSE